MPRRTLSFEGTWEHFTHLNTTQDSLALENRGVRRWLSLPYLAFLIPVDNPAARAQLGAWQNGFRAWMDYDPQPANRLHLTLHYIGGLRNRPWALLPHSWDQAALPRMAELVRAALRDFAPFSIEIGPLNAFANVLFAEVHDPDNCLRLLRARLQRALPLRARPPRMVPYLPHITLGYWGKQRIKPLVAALVPYREVQPLTLSVTRITFTIYTRDTADLGRDTLSNAREDIIAEYHLGHG